VVAGGVSLFPVANKGNNKVTELRTILQREIQKHLFDSFCTTSGRPLKWVVSLSGENRSYFLTPSFLWGLSIGKASLYRIEAF
jgi:hypothetical protein